jgi:ketosteroid isomerase-like protein
MAGFDAEAALRRLIDEADVAQVILRYADGLDRRNFDQVWACFTPDAEVTGSAFSGPLQDYLPRLLEGVRSFGATQHFMGNQLRSVDGDRAHTETYAVAHHFHDPAGEQEAIVMGVRYVDDLARQADGRWLIARRQASAMWTRRSA